MKKVIIGLAMWGLLVSHVAYAGDITGSGMSQKDLVTFLGNTVTTVNDIKTVVNDIVAKLQGNYLLTTPTLAIGSTPTAVSNVAFNYVIAGVPYAKAAVAAGTAPGNDVIPQNKYGAVAFDIGTDGTIDAIEAAANAAGYTTAALARAGCAAAATAHTRIGYVTAIKTDGAFTFGTTQLDAANTTVAYTNGDGVFAAISDNVDSSDLSLTGL